MSKWNSKLAVFLLAPVFLGTSCLTCFLHISSVSAATIAVPVQQDVQKSEEFQDCEKKEAEEDVVVFESAESSVVHSVQPTEISNHTMIVDGCQENRTASEYVIRQTGFSELDGAVFLNASYRYFIFPEQKIFAVDHVLPIRDFVFIDSVIKRE